MNISRNPYNYAITLVLGRNGLLPAKFFKAVRAMKSNYCLNHEWAQAVLPNKPENTRKFNLK